MTQFWPLGCEQKSTDEIISLSKLYTQRKGSSFLLLGIAMAGNDVWALCDHLVECLTMEPTEKREQSHH